MQYKPKLCLLQVLGIMLTGIPHIAAGQGVSTCDRALGEALLDVNNVRARITNTGGLFWRGEPHVYEVPKGSGSNAIFAGGIWIAGQVGGQLRATATTYGEWEMWAGPLDDDGNPPTNCGIYDRVYKVSRGDIDAFEKSRKTTPDLVDWPTGLGAPTYNSNGDLVDLSVQPFGARVDRIIDLQAGERPAILGNQSIWWVMNDRGNLHTSTDAPPVGLEVHGMAFAFDVPTAVGSATYYKFNFFYRGSVPLENSYLSVWADTELGNFDDDYVGTDTTLSMGYVYNSDNFDEGGEGYGTAPPALGIDFLQGPIVPSPGDTALVSGRAIPDSTNLPMTSSIYWFSGGGVLGGPGNAQAFYNMMRGLWIDGTPMTVGGFGRNSSEEKTKFMFTGDPVTNSCWSERNADCFGLRIDPGDSRIALSSGPFTLHDGDEQELIFAVVYGRGSDNYDSIRALRDADRRVQALYDSNYEVPEPPNRPIVKATPFDSGVSISWTNAPESNNYLESYRVFDPFSSGEDPHYEFEGYNVIQYTEETDHEGRILATYDVVNGVTRVLDVRGTTPEARLEGLTFWSATGSDSGVLHNHTVGGLNNSTSYYFGVQPYAFNEASVPKVFLGQVARFVVIPRRTEEVYSDLAVDAALSNAVPDFVADANAVGQGRVTADVVSPGLILENATYVTRFYEIGLGTRTVSKSAALASSPDGAQMDDYPVGYGRTDASVIGAASGAVTYDIERTVEGQTTTVFNGNTDGKPAPLRKNVILIDGLQFSVTGPAPGMIGFKMVANGGGLLDPPDMAAFAFNSSGFPIVEGRDRPEAGRNQSTNGSTWGIHVGGGTGEYGDELNGPFNQGTTWVGRSIRETPPWATVGSDDYEWRFPQSCFDTLDGNVTEEDCVSWRGFEDGSHVEVPFELWSTGLTSDPSDDYRMLPLICEEGCGHAGTAHVFDIAGDHAISGGDDDPFSDWIYWYKPEDNGARPGQAGYRAWFFGDGGLGERVFSRQVLVNWNGGSQRPFDADLPEAGSVIQYNTKKPNQPGDTFTFNTAGFGATPASDELKKSRLADINVVPNPYLGASDFERQHFTDEVRFSNMPLGEEATLRVFTLGGTLIETLFKPAGVNQLSWNLTTANNLPIASGIYLIHVEVKGIGTHVIKFAVIKKRVQLNVF